MVVSTRKGNANRTSFLPSSPPPHQLESGGIMDSSKESKQNHNDNNKISSSSSNSSSNNNNIFATILSSTTATSSSVLLYASAFFASMIVHELALEAATNSYGHKFDSLPMAVALFQFGFCFFLPLCISCNPKSILKTFPQSPLQAMPYIQLSALVFGATAVSTYSLSFGLSYPTKVVFKSAKLIPTMIVSRIIHPDSHYGLFDYIAAVFFCAGAAGYSFGASDSKNSNDSNNGTDKEELHVESSNAARQSIGLFLLTTSVFCDALVPNLQQRIMKSGPTISPIITPTTTTSTTAKKKGGETNGGGGGSGGISPNALMANVNVIGFTCILFYMTISGSLFSSIQTSLASPELFLYLIFVGLGLSSAVLAYTRLIRDSGSVAAVAVATMRKVATMVLSYVIFPKPFSMIHLWSGLFVLMGMMLSIYAKQRK